MAYFAETNSAAQVLRVVVCDSVQYLIDRLGGLWAETKIADPVQKYAGVGDHHCAHAPDQFLVDWRQPLSAQEGYARGDWSWHNGRAWRSNHPSNTSTTGNANWREYLTEWPQWNNGGEPYQVGDKATQAGNRYLNTVENNTAPPQQPNSGWVIQSPTTKPGKGRA